ncbi:M20/M25/M40 family metallo-hydrolase [Actinomadura luteofluorescens]|uniref:M20/M25/M40 family metallo-hydrolase n=1 Tax=Actinomadura luteofluorescens TaxID=46163 RepID=UPI00363A2AC6
MEDAGCAVRTDCAGNTIASQPGRNEGPAVGTGSHLDSVYAGGRFDGIAGVAAAVEVARMLHQAGVETDLPLRFVAFAAEEGARFGQACCGSKLAAGLRAVPSSTIGGIGTASRSRRRWPPWASTRTRRPRRRGARRTGRRSWNCT